MALFPKIIHVDAEELAEVMYSVVGRLERLIEYDKENNIPTSLVTDPVMSKVMSIIYKCEN